MRKSNQRKKELGQANREAFESAGLTYEGKSIKKIGKATGFGHAHITNLIRKYYEEGLQAISEKHYTGNRRNMSIDKEVAFLEPYCQRSEQGTRTGCPRNRSGLCEESRIQHWQQSDLSNAEATWLAKSHASEQASETSQEEIASSKNKQQAYPDDLKLCPLL